MFLMTQLKKNLEEAEVLSPKIENLHDAISMLYNNLEVDFIFADGKRKSCVINRFNFASDNFSKKQRKFV